MNAPTLTATNSGDGDILISDTVNLEALTASSGSISYTSDGTLTLLDASSVNLFSSQSGDTITVSSGSVNLSASGALSLSNNPSITLSPSQSSDISLNSPETVTLIGFDAFEIQADEQTQFFAPSSTQSVINRVIVPDSSSEISGSLTSNGGVYLVNPSGITGGDTRVVSDNGLTLTDGSFDDQLIETISVSVSPVPFGSHNYTNVSNFVVRPVRLQPVSITQTNDQLNSPLFSRFKKGNSSEGSIRSPFVNTEDTGLIAKFSAQASDSSQSIINLDR